jgi:glycosyltransferase involved in cell wall biosynthesis
MVSVIVPAYNEEKYIERCLESVLAQDQSPEFEVIVVDNGSSDKTGLIVRMRFPQVKLISEPKKGVVFARNRGAKEAQGEILFFVDADVVLPRRHIKNVMNKFKDDQKLVALSGPYAFEGNFYLKFITLFSYLFLALPAEYLINRLLGLAASGIAGNLAVRKEAFEKIGGFNEEIAFYGDDTDFFMRARRLGRTRFFFDLIVGTSGRRLQGEGVIKSLFRYIMNILWPVFFGHPLTKEHKDIR